MSYRALDVSLDGESTPSRCTSAPGRVSGLLLRNSERSRSVGMLLRHKSADEEIDRTLSDHVDMAQVMRDAEEERKARQLAEDGQHSPGWRCAARLLCGKKLLVQIHGRRYWRTTLQLYREQAELEAIRVVMVEGQPQAVGRMLQRTEEQLAKDNKADDGHRVFTSIFLRTWLKRKIEQSKVGVSCSTSASMEPHRAPDPKSYCKRDPPQEHIPFVFDMEHQRENFLHLSPFHSRTQVLGKLDDLTYRDYKAKQSFDWSSLPVTLQTDIFRESDADGDGRLDKADIRGLLDGMNINIMEAKFDQLFHEADTNGDGALDQAGLDGLIIGAIDFEREKERDSLHRAEQIVLGENQLIDRFGRLASRDLVEIYAERAEIECIIRQR